MNYRSNFVASVVFVLVFCLGLGGCARPPAQLAETAPTTVMVSYPVEEEVTDHEDAVSRTAAVESVQMRARVTGYLEKVNFVEGGLVKTGDVLFEIDRRPYLAQVHSAEGLVAASEAISKRAKTDNVRNRTLAAKSPGVVTQQDLDQYQAAEDQAIANVATAKANLETALLNLRFTKVTSPIDGRASRYDLTVGNLVNQDQTLLTTIVSVDPIYAYFDVDENTLLHVRKLIREGKAKSARDTTIPVLLGLANEDGFPHRGTINFVDNQVNPKTGTLRLRGVFPNKEEILSPGLFARVRVPIGGPHKALLVTDRAIDTDQGQKLVYVVNEKNEVVSRFIRTGALHGKLREIDDGLRPDERVIVNGLQLVRQGMTVEPKLEDMPNGPAARASAKEAKTPKPDPHAVKQDKS